MISHDLKCIFIHIPRCAGSSIEIWLTGKDWWSIDPKTKHLTSGQAKRLYAEYWDDYFTFSVVREPVSRSRSCLKHARHFGLRLEPAGTIDFAGYRSLFGDPVTVEYDHRFYGSTEVRHDGQLPGQIYGNILDIPVDFVARYETLQDDLSRIGRQLGVAHPLEAHAERSVADAPDLPIATQDEIRRLYERDLNLYGY